MERREFILNLIKSSSALALTTNSAYGAKSYFRESDRLGQILPTRAFGATSERLSTLCMGGAHIALVEEKTTQLLVEAAMEEGIRFFDTAYKYSKGVSEERYGKYLTPKYRDDVFIMTKCHSLAPKISPEEQLNTSLKRMKTDYVDLWMIHALLNADDAEQRIEQMLPFIEKAKESGKIRHFGFSGHYSTKGHLKALELTKDQPVRAVLMPMSPVDSVTEDSFIRDVHPRVIERNIAQLAMKTMGFGTAFTEKFNGKSVIPDRISIEENQWFVLSLPITSWVSGMTTVEEVRENAELVRRFTQLTEGDRLAIAEKVLDVANEMELQPYRRWLT